MVQHFGRTSFLIPLTLYQKQAGSLICIFQFSILFVQKVCAMKHLRRLILIFDFSRCEICISKWRLKCMFQYNFELLSKLCAISTLIISVSGWYKETFTLTLKQRRQQTGDCWKCEVFKQAFYVVQRYDASRRNTYKLQEVRTLYYNMVATINKIIKMLPSAFRFSNKKQIKRIRSEFL